MGGYSPRPHVQLNGSIGVRQSHGSGAANVRVPVMIKSMPWRKRSNSVSFAEMRAAHIGVVALLEELELSFRRNVDEPCEE